MLLIDPKVAEKFGTYQVIDKDRFNEFPGWDLICIIQEGSMEVGSVPCPGGRGPNALCSHGYSDHCYSQIELALPSSAQKTFFLIGLDTESVLGKLGQQLAEAETHATLDVNTIASLNKQIVELSRVLKDTQATSEQRSANLHSVLTANDALIAQAQRMELDLGKVRKHYGDAEIGKVLAAEE